MKQFYLLAAVLTLCGSCRDPELTELSFFSISFSKPEVIQVGTFQLQGQIKGLLQENIESCGFVWTSNQDSIQLHPAALRKVLPGQLPVGNDLFTSNFDLEPGQLVYIRAFGTLGARTVYSSNFEQVSLGQVVAMTQVAKVINDQATVYCLLSGLEIQQQTLTAYGHVYSATNPVPVVNGVDCDSTQYLNENEDGVYSSPLKGLSFNTTYYVRAYAIDGAQVFYSPTVDTFRVRDGWVKILDFPSEFNEGAAVATSGGVAFAGSGINNTNGLANEILNQFWQFDPLNETWQEATPFSNDPANKVTNSSMFTLGDTVYMIFGHHNIPNILMVRNFWKYAISSNTWYDASFEIPFTNAAFSGRSGATGFVLGNSFYVGTGQIIINNNRKYFHDFWQYTPQTGRWRRVKSLPLNASSGVQWQGRYEAIGFASADHGYVGGGELYGVPTTDFWRFTPPVGIQDSGLWELMPQSLPGVGRIGAIYFTLNGKAYYGCGYNVVERGQSDFYAFDFLTEQWTTKTPFQGGRRYNMISFGSNGNGYCGTGIEIQTINSGQTGQPFVHRDFWRYIPETP